MEVNSVAVRDKKEIKILRELNDALTERVVDLLIDVDKLETEIRILRENDY